MKMESKSRFDHLLDVTIRYKAHEQYGGRDGAVKALNKRLPSLGKSDTEAQVNETCKAYDDAVAMFKTGDYIKSGHSKFANPGDIKFDEWKNQIKREYPTLEDEILTGLLNWITFWYYLK